MVKPYKHVSLKTGRDLTSKELRVLAKHTTNPMYDANGTNVARRVVERVLVYGNHENNR